MAFSQQALATFLSQYPQFDNYVVAYSGGADSHVLLHALKCWVSYTATVKLSAIHIHHGLADRADEWEQHCRYVCRRLEIPVQVARVDAQPLAGDSPESAARQARYSALAGLLAPGQVLLTAHHLNDQAETLLLRLLRGAGVRGMGAMPVLQPFAGGWLLRPLLGFDRAALQEYARLHALQWIEDESNSDVAFDRNYLRHRVMPLLRERWPAADRTLARTAFYAAETDNLVRFLGHQDRISTARGFHSEFDAGLSVTGLRELSTERRRNLLRTWISDQGFALPSAKVLERLNTEMINAAEDRNPLVEWTEAQVRRYRQRIYLMPPLPKVNNNTALRWRPELIVDLPLGKCHFKMIADGGLNSRFFDHENLILRFRQGGETLRPMGRNRTITLKNLFQEQAIPPWLRDYLPLLYAGEKLIAVAGLAIDESSAVVAGETGCMPIWDLPHAYSGGIPIHE